MLFPDAAFVENNGFLMRVNVIITDFYPLFVGLDKQSLGSQQDNELSLVVSFKVLYR